MSARSVCAHDCTPPPLKIMSPRFDLIQILLEYAVEDDRIDLMLKNASPGKDFIRSIGLDGAAQRKARNASLVAASNYLVPAECEPFERAKALSKAVARFRDYLWPRLKNGVKLELLPHEMYLRRAFLVDKDVPASPDYLYKTLFK